MSEETAGVVLAAITSVWAIVWLISLRLLIAAYRGGQAMRRPGAGEGEFPEEGREGWFTGSAAVEGEASVLATRAAAALASGNPLTFGPVKILEKSDDRVRFARVEVMSRGRPMGQWWRQGELRFTPLGSGRTRVDWAVQPANMHWWLRIGATFQAAGFIAIVGGCWAIYTFIVSSPIATQRWLTFQMVQGIHFLWPPILFAELYKMGSKAVAAQFEALANNLPYFDGRAA